MRFKAKPATHWICLACEDGYIQEIHKKCRGCGKTYSDTLKELEKRQALRK